MYGDILSPICRARLQSCALFSGKSVVMTVKLTVVIVVETLVALIR